MNGGRNIEERTFKDFFCRSEFALSPGPVGTGLNFVISAIAESFNDDRPNFHWPVVEKSRSLRHCRRPALVVRPLC